MWFSGFVFKQTTWKHPGPPLAQSSPSANPPGLEAQPVPPTRRPMHVHVLPEGSTLQWQLFPSWRLLELEGARGGSVARD